MPKHHTRCFTFLLLIKKKKQNKTDVVGKGNTLDVMYVDISKAFVSHIKTVVLEPKNADYVNLCNNENF